jgi:hypothetical protein
LRTSDLYEPLIERNLNAIPAAVRAYRDAHGSDETFLAVARFAVLAYAPSQHSKHALLCCLAVHDLKAIAADVFDDLVTECAIYTASSRQPWSEPPLLTPPAVDDVPAAFDDRVSAERWLAARLDSPSLERDYFSAATNDFEDFGHKLIISVAAWRLSAILGEQGRYATLRIGVWEDCAYGGERYEEKGRIVTDLRERLLARMIEEEGSLESAHAVFLYDAATQAPEFVRTRVFDYLSNVATAFSPSSDVLKPVTTSVPVYRFARDLGECLIAHAVAQRLDEPQMVVAAQYNLDHAPSLEEWSFA